MYGTLNMGFRFFVVLVGIPYKRQTAVSDSSDDTSLSEESSGEERVQSEAESEY